MANECIVVDFDQRAVGVGECQALFVAVWALLMVVVGFVPIWFGYAAAPDGWRFTGLHAGTLNDLQGYMAWIRQARDGHLLFVDKFTSEPHSRVIFHPLFWGIGSVARWSGLSIMSLWHVVQGLSLVLLIFAIFWFCAEFTESTAIRVLALVLATTAAGLGWMFPGSEALPVIERPIDLWQLEANPFRAICSSFFTLTLALALMLWVVIGMMRYFRTGRLRDAARAGGLTLLLAAVHHYDVLTLYAVLGAWALLAGRRRWAGMIVLVAMSAPYLLYGFLAVRLDPVLSGIVWFMEVPPVSAYLVGWGLPLTLAALALLLPSVWRDHPHVRLLLVWIAVNPVLLVLPVAFRRKLIWGMHVIICILAAMAIRALAARLTAGLADRPRFRKTLAAAAALPAVAFMAIGSSQFLLAEVRERTFGRFLPEEVAEAFHRLDEESGEHDVVLAGPALAGFVPGWTGATVFWGHWAQTVDVARKIDLARRLITPGALIDRDAVVRALAEHRIRYVVLDAASAAASTIDTWPIPVDRFPVDGTWPIALEQLPIHPFVRSIHRDGWVEILEVRTELLRTDAPSVAGSSPPRRAAST